MKLPDVKALFALPFAEHSDATGIKNFAVPETVRAAFDAEGLWWVVPFAAGTSGCKYAFRLALGPGHGAVLRCLDGHAVTIASSPDRAIFAMLAIERLLGGKKSRARLHDGWSQARKVIREAVKITGGSPDKLEPVLHLADDLPNWVNPAPAEDERTRRAMLLRITNDTDSNGEIWNRSNDSREVPDDAKACLRLLEGNHGLDGTHANAGLLPNSVDASELLIACAKKVVKAKLKPDPKWAPVIAAIASKAKPKPPDFISAVGKEPTAQAWDALGAVSFWFNAILKAVPEEQTKLAEKIAKQAKATHILEARRLLDGIS